jgi:Subtilase family
MGGPHDGSSLVERAMDNMLAMRTNTMICQSTGNYYSAQTHSSGRVKPWGSEAFSFFADEKDTTPNEAEIWYSGRDNFTLILEHEQIAPAKVKLGEKQDVFYNGALAGRAYNRKADPNNDRNHINIFLYNNAPKGKWTIRLIGKQVADGRYNAWIERDSGCKACQSRFLPPHSSPHYTTGTICNGYHTLVTGAIDASGPQWKLPPFSSEGPTTDGRCKPDLLAPGTGIAAARSAPKWATRSTQSLTKMSGTSMASPHVTGAVAAVLEILPPGTPFSVIRNCILSSTSEVQADPAFAGRIGNGLLNVEKAVEMAGRYSLKFEV